MSKLKIILLFVLALRADSLHSGLEGKHLNVMTLHYPPMIVIKEDSGQRSFSGPLIQQLQWLSARLKFNYTLRAEPSNFVGSNVNGTWEGLLGRLARKEIDLAIFPFAISLARSQVMKHVGFIGGDIDVFLNKYPEPQISWKAASQPFTVQVWLGWLLSLVFITMASTVIVLVRSKFVKQDQPLKALNEMIMDIVGNIISQGTYYPGRNVHFGILAAAWCLAAFIFVNVYCGTLTSYLASSYNRPDVNTMHDLGHSPKYQMVVLKGLLPEFEMLEATAGPRKLIGDKLRRCNVCRTRTMEEVGDKVLSGDYIGVVTGASGTRLVEASYQLHKQCRLTFDNERSGWRNKYLAVPRTSSYVEEIDRELHSHVTVVYLQINGFQLQVSFGTRFWTAVQMGKLHDRVSTVSTLVQQKRI